MGQDNTTTSRAGATTEKFDAEYYRRHYQDPFTRVSAPEELEHLGDFVCGALRYLKQPVRRALDLGCGLGAWREIIAGHFPSASYTGVEVSAYLCKEHGWEQGSVVDWRSRQPFDLVICNDVVQYLDDDETEAALNNLAWLCEGVLYFGVLTEEDWAENCDKKRTEEADHLRSGQWYRERLARNFRNFGGGLFISNRARVVLYELEQLR